MFLIISLHLVHINNILDAEKSSSSQKLIRNPHFPPLAPLLTADVMLGWGSAAHPPPTSGLQGPTENCGPIQCPPEERSGPLGFPGFNFQ